MSAETINKFKVDLEKALSSNSESQIKDIIQALSKTKMTYAYLQSSRIGVVVNNVKKKMSGDIAKMAGLLVTEWKSLAATSRSSSRAAAKNPVDYNEEKVEAPVAIDAARLQQKGREGGGGATIYPDIAAPPKRNAKGEFCFADHPEFRPNLSPSEVLQMGSFGGTYFRPIYSSVTGKKYGDEVWKELPSDWLKGLDIKKQVSCPAYRNSVNTYNCKCGGDLEMWESSGWINGIDPYGWFQWYCRFFQGRRSSDDTRQIGRGNQCMGPKGRWRSNLCGKIIKGCTGRRTLETEVENKDISPVIRQVLQHWGYKPTVEDVAEYKKRKGL